MRASNNTRCLFVAEVAFKCFQAHPTCADFQQAAYNNSDHAR